MSHDTAWLLSQHGFVTCVGLHWFGWDMGRQRIERSVKFLVSITSRGYQMLFTDQDLEGLCIMRDGHHGDIFCCS